MLLRTVINEFLNLCVSILSCTILKSYINIIFLNIESALASWNTDKGELCFWFCHLPSRIVCRQCYFVCLQIKLRKRGIDCIVRLYCVFFWIFQVCTTKECVQGAAYILNKLDTTVDPCTDFYQYSCGNWIKNVHIPPSKSKYGSFSMISDEIQAIMKEVC